MLLLLFCSPTALLSKLYLIIVFVWSLIKILLLSDVNLAQEIVSSKVNKGICSVLSLFKSCSLNERNLSFDKI